ncbi:ATP-binding protein [Mesorhizobium sp. DCY119]|uniref:ATP-binding protein n=1 Tax=Mesorhizobium sp. DCY119 TaxID=2108445 RepID=UPI000E6B8448|nr:ATP-binding protein [Mesorhizobium sp. DCY119]RJG46536.1 oxidoreductase [Mesorhizobium sp. DCY119]
MAISFDQLRRVEDPFPPIVIIYGGEGMGKTSFAGDWPNPFYVQTGANERPPVGVDMLSFGLTETYQEFVDQCDWMLEAEHDRLTFVVDTLDSLEQIVIDEACARRGWKDISDGKFREPKDATAEVWREILRKFTELKASGFAVILIAHIVAKTDPGVITDSIPRYRLNLRMQDDANSLTHAADIVGFIHQRVSIQKEAGGFHKDNVKKRGEGSGERLIAVEERPGFIAKNRHKLTGALTYKAGQGYAIFEPHIVAPFGREAVPEEQEAEA